MDWMDVSRCLRSGLLALAPAVVAACVSDHAVENDVRASPGLVQPDGSSGASVTADVACEKIAKARAAAADKLGCDAPSDVCPSYLFVGGSIPCGEFVGGSIDACVAWIGAYERCSDFGAKPCVVTPVGSSCREPQVPEGGGAERDGRAAGGSSARD